MKAGDVHVVQYESEHGGFRVLPLRSVSDLGSMEMLRGEPVRWGVVGYSVDEGDAHGLMRSLKEKLKGVSK